MLFPQAQSAFDLAAQGGASQEDRELAEALRVQAMGVAERSQWLQTVWGRAQRNAAAFAAHAPELPRTARSYASPDEKNQFDEARELELAMRYSVFATGKLKE
jgi:hypothetical protein